MKSESKTFCAVDVVPEIGGMISKPAKQIPPNQGERRAPLSLNILTRTFVLFHADSPTALLALFNLQYPAELTKDYARQIKIIFAKLAKKKGMKEKDHKNGMPLHSLTSFWHTETSFTRRTRAWMLFNTGTGKTFLEAL